MPAGDLVIDQIVMDCICEQIADGKSLRQILAADGMPSMSVFFRVLRDESNDAWRQQYTRAREDQAEALDAEISDVARQKPERVIITIGDKATKENVDVGEVQHRRLLIDTLKWRAGKLKPKVYGDKTAVEHTGTLTLAQLVEQSQKPPAPS